MSQQRAKQFGKYILQKRLAMGGMAEIFRAQLIGAAGFSKEVVIKRIHPEYSKDPEFVEMFTKEANIAVMLNHPNVVQVLDFDKFEDTYYLAMELVDGLDLQQTLQKGRKYQRPLPFALRLYLIDQALRGLNHTHNLQRGGETLQVIHRDISPHNLMLSVKGEVKVTDFGIARVIEHASNTAKGVIKGKLSYMAPEQTYSSKVDQRADLWALGVILWELLCDQRLFDAPDELQALDRLRNAPIDPPHLRNPEVSPELSGVVMKALARDVEERFPTAKSFQRALRPFLDHNIVPEEDLSQYIRKLKARDKAPPGTAILRIEEPEPMPPAATPGPSDKGEALSSDPNLHTPEAFAPTMAPKRSSSDDVVAPTFEASDPLGASDQFRVDTMPPIKLEESSPDDEDWMLRTEAVMPPVQALLELAKQTQSKELQQQANLPQPPLAQPNAMRQASDQAPSTFQDQEIPPEVMALQQAPAAGAVTGAATVPLSPELLSEIESMMQSQQSESSDVLPSPSAQLLEAQIRPDIASPPIQQRHTPQGQPALRDLSRALHQETASSELVQAHQTPIPRTGSLAHTQAPRPELPRTTSLPNLRPSEESTHPLRQLGESEESSIARRQTTEPPTTQIPVHPTKSSQGYLIPALVGTIVVLVAVLLWMLSKS